MTHVSPTRSDAAHAAAADDGTDRDACETLLADGDAALAVLLRATPREWLADRAGVGADTAFVATYPHPNCVRVLSDLREPVEVALAAEAFLESLPEDAAPAVCIDSLDPLVERAGPLRAARFYHVLANRVRAAGGTLHCHDDPPLPDLSSAQL